MNDIVAFICVYVESNYSDLDFRTRIDQSFYCKHLFSVFQTISCHRLLRGKTEEIFCKTDLFFNTLPYCLKKNPFEKILFNFGPILFLLYKLVILLIVQQGSSQYVPGVCSYLTL